jgi:aminoglycoside phosphotransferase (APT) family kinase protein
MRCARPTQPVHIRVLRVAAARHSQNATSRFGGRLRNSTIESTPMPRSAHGEESLNASPWDGQEVWVHGDLLPGNLLVVDGRLSAVIDFGCLNVGDPACDLQPAWNVFADASRARYRAHLRANDASWLRGRGWALYQAVMALPYYWHTNPGMIRQASE